MVKIYRNWKSNLSQSTQWLIEAVIDTGLIIGVCYVFCGILYFMRNVWGL